jgi:acyl carrier protein
MVRRPLREARRTLRSRRFLDKEVMESFSMRSAIEMNGAALVKNEKNENGKQADLLAMFRETATEVVEKDFHHVTEATVISELSIDSLGMLEIIGSMERQLKIQIPDESLSGISTIRDLIAVVEERIAVARN